MKLWISIGANIVLFVLVLVLGIARISNTTGDNYYRKSVYFVACGAVRALAKGDTNVVLSALRGIKADPDAANLIEAGSKLGVFISSEDTSPQMSTSNSIPPRPHDTSKNNPPRVLKLRPALPQQLTKSLQSYDALLSALLSPTNFVEVSSDCTPNPLIYVGSPVGQALIDDRKLDKYNQSTHEPPNDKAEQKR